MSLLFEVFNAITGTTEEPATHNMPSNHRQVLQHLANRAGKDGRSRPGIGCLESDTGLGASTVRQCVTDLEKRGWIGHVGWHGPIGRQVRVFEIRSSGEGWEPSSTRARKPPPPRLKAHPLPPFEPLRAAGGATDGGNPPSRHSTGAPPAIQQGPLPPGGDKPPSGPLCEPPKEPKAAVRGSLGALALPGFEVPPTPEAAIEESIWATYLRGRAKYGAKGPRPVLDEPRRRMIRGRLADGFSPDDLRVAADGLWQSDWHRLEKRTGFELCMRDAAAVEKCQGYAARARVDDAYEMPDRPIDESKRVYRSAPKIPGRTAEQEAAALADIVARYPELAGAADG